MIEEKEDEPNFSISLLNKPTIINKGIYLFTITLLKKIFIKSAKKDLNKINNHLNEWIKYINKDIIKKKVNYISTEYSLKNLKNIILFIKTQNRKYHGDIIETMIIYIFSLAFKTDQDNAFCKFIFNNLTRIRERKNPELIHWIVKEKIIPDEFMNLVDLLEIDRKYDLNIEIEEDEKKNIFYGFLKEILFQKFPYKIFNHNKNDKILKYIHHGDFLNFTISNLIYNKIRLNPETIVDKDIAVNSMMNMVSNISMPFSPKNKPINPIILMFFTQVYVFFQNKHSPLLKYAFPSKNYATIKFLMDLRGACIEGRFANAVLSPLMVQDFYSKIFLKQNNFREMGMFELGKICVFNNNIKHIESETCLIKSSYLDFLTYAMGLFDNYSVEELNISYNYLKEDSEEFIIKILMRFKGLKTINLSSNDMKGGIGNFFVVLKKLFRTKKTKLENLILNKCILDYSSLYELGELLKSKFCGLKRLVLNNNSFPQFTNFLKSLKKNKILTDIYLNKTELNNTHVDDILRIITNTNIRYLYLYKNKMNNFNDFLRILYRTKIVKQKEEIKANKIVIINESTSLVNLDLSNNDYSIKNHRQIKLLEKILKETSLYCLDICHILYGPNPDKWKGTQDNLEYKKSVEDIKKNLEEIKNKYETLIQNIRSNTVDVGQNKKLEEEKFLQKYNKKEIIDKILQDKNSGYSAFLKAEAVKMLRDDKDVIKDNIEKYEESVEKLMNFFILKRSEKTLDELKKEKYQKKLILI